MTTVQTAGTSSQTTITITTEGANLGQAEVKFNNTTKNLLRKNSQSALFSIYGSGQNPVKLFVEKTGVTPPPTPLLPGAITATPAAGEVAEGTEVTFTSEGATSMTATDGDGAAVTLTAGTDAWTYTVNADITLNVTATNDQGSTGPTAFAYTVAAAPQPGVQGTYRLVTSANDLVAGAHYVIAANTKATPEGSPTIVPAMGFIPTDKTYFDKVDANISSDLSTLSPKIDNALNILTLGTGTAANTYTLQQADGKYVSNNGNGTNNYASATAQDLSITIGDNASATINFGSTGVNLQYNASSPRFKIYTSTQTPIQLYVENASAPQTVPGTPVITFDQTTVEDNGEYSNVRHGTVFTITSTGATSIVITDEDNNATTLSQAPFTWTPALGEHIYTVKGVNSVGESTAVTFSLTIVAAVPDKPVVTYVDADGTTVTVADESSISVPQGTVFTITSAGATSVTITDGTNDVSLTSEPFTWTPAICNAVDYLIGGINAEGTSPLFILTLTVTRVPETVAAPTFSPVSGTYMQQATEITITAAEGCVIEYAVNNGTDVTSTTNTVTLTLNQSDFTNDVATVTAFAANAYQELSATAVATYHWGVPTATTATFYAYGCETAMGIDVNDPQYTAIKNAGNEPSGPVNGGTPSKENSLTGQSFTNPTTGIVLGFGSNPGVTTNPAVFYKDGPGVRMYRNSASWARVTAPEGKYLESISAQKLSGTSVVASNPPFGNATAYFSNEGSVYYFNDELTTDSITNSSDTRYDFNTVTITICPRGGRTAPFSIEDAVNDQDGQQVWVTGFIVGSVLDLNDRESINFDRNHSYRVRARVDGTTEPNLNVATNIVLAQVNDYGEATQQWNTLVPAELLDVQVDAAINDLNLADHAELLGRKVKIHGTLGSYGDGPGMINPDQYILFPENIITGIDDVVMPLRNDQAPVQYYNLQGQRILNPQPGTVVIRRQGSEATKVML